MFKIIIDANQRFGLLHETLICPTGWKEIGKTGSPVICAGEIEELVHSKGKPASDPYFLLTSSTSHYSPQKEYLNLLPRHHSFFTEWFLENPNHYVLPALVELNDNVDLEITEQALYAVLKHHNALHVGFEKLAEGWRGFILNFNESISIFSICLAEITPKDREVIFDEIVLWAKSSLDITNGPVVKAILFDMGTEKRLLIVFHHVLVDAFSRKIIMRDLIAVYQQLLHNTHVSLPMEMTSSQEWVRQLTEYTNQSSARIEMKYWLSLPWDEIVDLPITTPNYNNPDDRLDIWYSNFISDEDTLRVQNAAKINGIDIRTVLLTALAQTFAIWTGGRTFLIEDVGHGRGIVLGQVSVWRTVGWLVTHTPIILDIRGATSSQQMLIEINDQLNRIPIKGVGYSGLKYVNYHQDEVNRLKMLPRAQVLFNYFGYEPDIRQKPNSTNLVRGFLTCNDAPLKVTPPYSMLVQAYFKNNCLHFRFSCSDRLVNILYLVQIFSEKLKLLGSMTV